MEQNLRQCRFVMDPDPRIRILHLLIRILPISQWLSIEQFVFQHVTDESSHKGKKTTSDQREKIYLGKTSYC